MTRFCTITLFSAAALLSCNHADLKQGKTESKSNPNKTKGDSLILPRPYATKSAIRFAEVIGWPAGKTPLARDGFTVTKFADGLDNPRGLYEGPNGDVFVSEATIDPTVIKKFLSTLSPKYKSMNFGKSANRITLLRDTNNDGIYDIKSVFLEGLNQPFGMLILNNKFYVANTDGIMVFPYLPGELKISGRGKKILDLPAGGYNNHWTRNIIANQKGSKIYVSVGSGTNIAEHGIANETGRACIIEINPDGTGKRIFAGGLRNPVGMAWAPGTNTLWAAVNERDELGDELVPDYATSIKEDGFYGWPYTYWGNHPDPRIKEKNPHNPDSTLIPDISLGAHTASLGIVFDGRNLMPGKYRGGAFIAQHGSWNRSSLVGYQVVFIPFSKGKPVGWPETFLNGFIADTVQPKAYGRPVAVLISKNGKLLVTDDAANTVWCVSQKK